MQQHRLSLSIDPHVLTETDESAGCAWSDLVLCVPLLLSASVLLQLVLHPREIPSRRCMHQTAATLIRIHARAFTNASRRSMSSAAAASQAQQTKAPRSLAALLACPQDYERTKPLRVDMPDGAPQPTVSIMDFNILARV